MAAAAIAVAHDRLAPAGFQGGLGHQVTRVDTDTLGGLFGHRQHGGDECVAVGERFVRRQGWLRHGPAGDAQAAFGHGKALRHLLPIAGRHGGGIGGRRRIVRRGHDTGQQAVGQLARQRQAP
ncbi:hypothetical protein D3C81_1517340 [compost metagenome]